MLEDSAAFHGHQSFLSTHKNIPLISLNGGNSPLLGWLMVQPLAFSHLLPQLGDIKGNSLCKKPLFFCISLYSCNSRGLLILTAQSNNWCIQI